MKVNDDNSQKYVSLPRLVIDTVLQSGIDVANDGVEDVGNAEVLLKDGSAHL